MYEGSARDTHAPAPKKYAAASLHEYDQFLDSCYLEFEKNSQLYPTDERRILYAVGYLGDETATRWRNFKNGQHTGAFTWVQFSDVLRRALGDEGNLWITSNKALDKIRLEPGESVDSFVARLDRLNRVVGNQLDEGAKIAELLRKLPEETQTKIQESDAVYYTRADLIAKAVRLLELSGKRRKASPDSSGDERKKRGGRKGRYTSGRDKDDDAPHRGQRASKSPPPIGAQPRRGQPNRNDDRNPNGIPLDGRAKAEGKTTEVVNCFKCKQPGHYAPQCPTMECYNCHAFGHIATNCPKPDQRNKRGPGSGKE